MATTTAAYATTLLAYMRPTAGLGIGRRWAATPRASGQHRAGPVGSAGVGRRVLAGNGAQIAFTTAAMPEDRDAGTTARAARRGPRARGSSRALSVWESGRPPRTELSLVSPPWFVFPRRTGDEDAVAVGGCRAGRSTAPARTGDDQAGARWRGYRPRRAAPSQPPCRKRSFAIQAARLRSRLEDRRLPVARPAVRRPAGGRRRRGQRLPRPRVRHPGHDRPGLDRYLRALCKGDVPSFYPRKATSISRSTTWTTVTRAAVQNENVAVGDGATPRLARRRTFPPRRGCQSLDGMSKLKNCASLKAKPKSTRVMCSSKPML